MNPYAEHADLIRQLQTEQGSDCPAIWFNSRLIKILPGSAKIMSENETGGDALFFDLEFTAIAADFDAGTLQDNVPFNYPGTDGNEFKIQEVQFMAGGLQVRVRANAASQEM